MERGITHHTFARINQSTIKEVTFKISSSLTSSDSMFSKQVTTGKTLQTLIKSEVKERGHYQGV